MLANPATILGLFFLCGIADHQRCVGGDVIPKDSPDLTCRSIGSSGFHIVRKLGTVARLSDGLPGGFLFLNRFLRTVEFCRAKILPADLSCPAGYFGFGIRAEFDALLGVYQRNTRADVVCTHSLLGRELWSVTIASDILVLDIDRIDRDGAGALTLTYYLAIQPKHIIPLVRAELLGKVRLYPALRP
jgi:hypothetical protein